jgi:anti-sigma regulatory factor (Ser/Thr protein kinase)
MGTQFTAFLQLEHEEKRIYGSIFIMFVVNALSNLLFVAVFKLGLFGLGLATSLGNLFFFLIQAVYFLGKKAVIRFCRDSIVLSDIKEILINGFPRAITHFGISIRMILLNSMIQQYVGENGLAAYSAVYSFSCVQWSIPAGVTSAVMTLGSVYVGEEDKMGLKTLMKTFLTRGVPLVLLAAIVESALCLPATNLFFHDPLSAVYQMTLIGFMLFPLYTPFSTLMAGFSNYYHCLSHEGIVRTLSVADGIVAVCLFTFILIPIFGMNGVWAGQIVGSAFCVLIILIYATIYNKRPVFDLDGLMCFDKDFGVPDDQRIDITIRSMDEVINLSERILNFCNSFGVSGRRRYFSALCTEELAGNIVRHGFKDGKKHSIDIRVSYVNEEIVISFKDDGIPFNPEEAARLFGTEYKAESGVNIEDLHNIGLQLVSRISKSMTYQNTFGLNILTLVV